MYEYGYWQLLYIIYIALLSGRIAIIPDDLTFLGLVYCTFIF